MAIDDMPKGLAPEMREERIGERAGQEQCLCTWWFCRLEKSRDQLTDVDASHCCRTMAEPIRMSASLLTSISCRAVAEKLTCFSGTSRYLEFSWTFTLFNFASGELDTVCSVA
jgi:hypothetical protein